MDNTANLALPLIQPQQALKHVTHNEAVARLDHLVHICFSSRELTSPPSDPAEGVRFLLPSGCSGEWADREGLIAARQNGGWVYIAPRPGFLAWDAQSAVLSVFDGVAWQTVQTGNLVAVGFDALGINATPDPVNRLVVSGPGVLFSHDGDDHRLALNKASVTDTASLVFQSGFSGRAEIGLAGEDALSFKVSTDGTAFATALVTDPQSGAVSMPLTPCGQVNFLLNGDFAINQRGFSGGALAAGSYGYDRWKAGAGGCVATVSGGQLAHDSGSLLQIIEAPDLAGRVMSLGVEDLAGGDLVVTVAGETGTITPGAGRRGVSFTLDPAASGDIEVSLEPATGAVVYSRVQLNLGRVPLAFEKRFASQEAALCQRYFTKTYELGVAPGTVTNVGALSGRAIGNYGSYGLPWRWQFPVAMRAAPTVVVYSTETGDPDKLYNATASSDLPGIAQNASTLGCTITNHTVSTVTGSLYRTQVIAEAEL